MDEAALCTTGAHSRSAPRVNWCSWETAAWSRHHAPSRWCLVRGKPVLWDSCDAVYR